MISLKKARSTIFSTECGKCIKEGLECSEPIITQDENGLIDNYFVYGCDSEGRHFTKPLVGFGVYTDKEKTAYLGREFEFEDKDYISSDEINMNQSFEAFDKYSEVYPRVREFVYKKCDDEEKVLLRIYLDNLKLFSGSVIYSFYEKIYPEFFEWVCKELEQA